MIMLRALSGFLRYGEDIAICINFRTSCHPDRVVTSGGIFTDG